ncbi:peptidase domain-containing ABC transporter [Microseira wollei]|uniref:Cyclic nucleotide-binding protein n=1 Tax=Microseira wollei NIES-4236 TaxID=2530354 RepID=A0AAV3XQ23_9CYAN|nr:peptidase domain-containing ABC transporter [Microseira wollei]GET43768.1 cyclic nucleotide-binding protein [Microseira wollei NIES-4236]
MNQTASYREKFPSRDNQEESNLLLAVQKLFNAARVDASLASEFEQSLKVSNLELGDEAFNCILPDSSQNIVRQEHNGDNFYIVCQGRVRLLGVDAFGQQQVSAVVLEEGETFGADALLCPRALPYRAIAAGALQVACLEAAQLARWLERLPALREYLEGETQKRQRQIFFKTSTDLRRLPSHQLREIVPNIAEIRIRSGESLAKATPASGGRYWLGSGELSRGNKGEVVSDLHPSWGYPEETPPDWVAKTDLLVYQLGLEDWQAASAIAPKYFNPSGDAAANNGQKSANPRKKPKGQRTISPSSTPSPQPKDKDPNPPKPPGKSPNVVAFPKPVRRLRWPWQGYPLILQQSSSDCGAACLSMISLYWGKRFTISYLRELVNVGLAGASLKNLAAGAESLGFMARPVRASIGKMAEQKNPWIAHWQGIHYVVVYKCKGNRIVVADPAQGKKSISRKEFLQNWSGYALVLDPTPRLRDAESQKISLGRFVGALGSYKSLMAQIILTSLLVQVFSVVTPLFTQIIFDQVVVHKSLPTLNIFILGLLLFNFWNMGLGATRQYLLAFFSNRLNLTLIGGFINHTLMLPLKFFESRRVGDILTRVQENNKIQQFLIGQVVLAWLDMLMGLIYLGLMLYYNLQLTLLVLALIPPIVILTLVATPILRQVSREIFNESAEQNSLLVEMLTGVSTVKAVAAEREVRWRWEDRFTNTLNLGFKGQNLGIGLQVISGSINTLGGTALLWYGATLVIQDQLTIGQFMAFNMMIGRVISPFLALVGMWNQLQEVLISVERLNDVFEAEPEQIPGKPMLILPRLRGEVRFENVSFRYSPDQERNTLQNISFEAHPGQTIAIVGRSGSGKSTLVKLLQGLYYADTGRVLIDGHDLRHVSPQSFRSQLGVVPQESFLFSGTILENITLYRPDFTLEQVTEVGKLAEAHTFIQDLPLGYNTKVGERGASLSGGQRQRVSIARALLGAPPILVLDEATSSLDTESERRFQNNLERLSRDRTTFIIAHRLSTVRNADSILVLDRGILVEQGNHEQLMALQGLYFHLAQQQLNL